MLRWNQVMRELVARYNLPPAPRDNGTYVFPDANNPFADPQFPFANPPYAARAYSYVSVAQFEALKVAWYYKFLYNRPAPSQVDGGVQALLPASDVPAYPSEDAVLSGVSAEMLKLLFPAAVEEITLQGGGSSARRRSSAGGRRRATSRRDWRWGGRWPRCSSPAPATDGMGAAAGTPAQWQALADAAAARGEIPWKSLESPAAAADAPELRQGARVDDDPDRRRRPSARPAARRPPRRRWRRSSPRSSAPRTS